MHHTNSRLAEAVRLAVQHTASWLLLVSLCCGHGWPGAAAAAGEMDAYFADSIWTGREIIPDGVLLVQDGKVVSVGGRDVVDVPPQAKQHRLGKVTLLPGLVLAHSNLGESAGNDEYAVRPEVRAADGFDPFDDYSQLLAGGVTTVQISPRGDRLMPGQGAVVKLAGEKSLDQILAGSESLNIVLTQDALSPPTVYEPPVGAVSVERPVEPTRPQLATSSAQALVGLRALLAEAAEVVDGKYAEDEALLALAELIQQESTLRWTAETRAEVQAALRLAEEAGLPWLIVDPVDIDGLLEISDWDSDSIRGVVLNTELRPGRITNPSVPGRLEKPETPVWTRAAQLIAAGAGGKLALWPASDADIEKMLYVATLLGRAGIEKKQILQLLTSNPAKMLGVADLVGSLEAGKDADFLILSGEPLSASGRVLATYVDGRMVFEAIRTDSNAVIAARHIVTPNGIFTDGSITVSDGKIRGVGRSVSLSQSTPIKDFGDAYVVPGFIDMATSLGIGGSLSDNIPLGTELGELLSRNDDQIAVARQGGVTTALLSSTRLPSPVVAFKLSDTPVVVKDPVAIRFGIDDNLTTAETSLRRTLQSGKAYADSWNKYDADFAEYQKKLKEYETAKQKFEAAKKAAEAKKKEDDSPKDSTDEKSGKPDGKEDTPPKDEKQDSPSDKPKEEDAKDGEKEGSDDNQKSGKGSDSKAGDVAGKESEDDAKSDSKEPIEPKKPDEPKKPKEDENLDPYRDLFAGKIVAIVEVSEVKAAQLAVKLFRDEFKLKTAVVAGSASAKNATLLSEKNVLAVVGPSLVAEEDGKLVNFAASLSLAQVPIAFQSKASTGVQELPQAISYAVYEGLGADDALAGLTSSPSKFLGLDAIGAIQAGSDADLVVLSGPPLELSSEVLAVMIDGRWVYEKEIH